MGTVAVDFLLEVARANPGAQVSLAALLELPWQSTTAVRTVYQGFTFGSEAWESIAQMPEFAGLDEGMQQPSGRAMHFFGLQAERGLHRFTPSAEEVALITLADEGEDAASLTARHARFVRTIEGVQGRRRRASERRALRSQYQPIVRRDAQQTAEVRGVASTLAAVSAELLQLRSTRRRVRYQRELAMGPVLLSLPAGRLRLEEDAARSAGADLALDEAEDRRLMNQLAWSPRRTAVHGWEEEEAALMSLSAQAEEARRAAFAAAQEATLPAEVRVLHTKEDQLDRRIAALTQREVELRTELEQTTRRVEQRLLRNVLITQRSTL
jgi:hypothetical protein